MKARNTSRLPAKARNEGVAAVYPLRSDFDIPIGSRPFLPFFWPFDSPARRRVRIIGLAFVLGICLFLAAFWWVGSWGEKTPMPDEGIGPNQNQGNIPPIDPPSLGGSTEDEETVEGSTETLTSAETVEMTDPETETAETDTADTGAGEETTSEEPETDWETNPEIPEGCYPFVKADVSQSERGVDFVAGYTAQLPAVLPTGKDLWRTDGAPAVLVVHTHPYEGYGDGGLWYDPGQGGFAVTQTPNSPDGIVAVGTELTGALRKRGVTVMQVRIAVSEEDTAEDIYLRTQEVVRSYCRLYPDIGLVLDMRRSAELTETGGILRTQGILDGEACAQLRISVSGDRTEWEKDLAAALALRRGMWDVEPTLSRPVRVKTGMGLGADLDGVRLLTLEMGSAGNTCDEVRSLVPALADAVYGMLSAAE